MRILIVGYGSAGVRWEKWIEENVDAPHIETCDPFLAGVVDHEEYPDNEAYDVTIICTPPDLHLKLIKRAVKNSERVLCEKPAVTPRHLTALNELFNDPDYNKVRFAFNYVFHPNIINLHWDRDEIKTLDFISTSVRSHEPSWGFTLDNFSHTVSIAMALTGGFEPSLVRTIRLENHYWGVVEANNVGVKDVQTIEMTAQEVIKIANPNDFPTMRSAGVLVNKTDFVSTLGSMDTMMCGVWHDLHLDHDAALMTMLFGVINSYYMSRILELRNA